MSLIIEIYYCKENVLLQKLKKSLNADQQCVYQTYIISYKQGIYQTYIILRRL